jgi:hypothetical protein
MTRVVLAKFRRTYLPAVAVASREVPVTVIADGMTEITIRVQPSPRRLP